MEVLGITFTVWTIVQTVLLLFLFSVIYDWIQLLLWRRKYNIKGPFPFPLLGTLPQFLMTKDIDAQDLKSTEKYGPVFGGNLGVIKFLMVTDVNLLKKIFIKDHSDFINRYTLDALDPWPMQYTLLSLKDAHWKHVRSVVTPTFSAGKLKKMTPEINYCAELLTAGLAEKATSGEVVDSRRHFGCFTMDVIASTAFGIRTDSYNNPNDPFVTLAQKVFGQDSISLPVILAVLFPNVAKFLAQKCKMSAYYPRDSLAFFTDVIKKIIKERQETGDTSRVDLLQLLLNAESEAEPGTDSYKKLTMDEILAQGLIVFVAGYETTSALLTYVSYILATHPDVQDKLIAEIDSSIPPDVKEIKYDVVMEMPYLDQVINETLRLYPPVSRMNRITTQNRDVELDGQWFPAGTQIMWSVYSIHRSPEFYPEPEKFRPERFSAEEKAKRDPFVFMPFGQGPRNCIGMRLALIEAKIGVVAMLRKLKFVKCPETEENLETNRFDAFVRPKRPIKVGVELREAGDQ